MRRRQAIDIPAGGRWPDSEGGFDFGHRFSWALVENRGAAAVVLATNQRVQADVHDYLRRIAAGERRVFNFGDETDPTEQLPTELQFLSLGGATTIYFEIANHPIVDIAAPPTPQPVSMSPAASTTLNVSQVQVAQAAVQLIGANNARVSLTLKNSGANAVFIGPTNAVTAAGGHNLGAGGAVSFSSYSGAVWAISAAGNNVVTMAEEAA